MTTETRTINGFTFRNEQINYTRAGFQHETTVYFNKHRIASASNYYMNRTWEAFTFQTTMILALKNALLNQKAMHSDIEATIKLIRAM